MPEVTLQTTLINHFSEKFGSFCQATPVSGGDINTCFLIHCGTEKYFVKLNDAEQSGAMFRTEVESLRELGSQSLVKIPAPVALGSIDSVHYLIMEALHLGGHGDWEAMGKGLAAIHRIQSDYYGWKEDNFIGRNIQHNQKCTSWCTFWWECRLRPQLDLACDRGHRAEIKPLTQVLKDATQTLLERHQPPASLLHGDLWRGNAGFDRDGRPALYDPATYYGDRETDLALTRLFGGFPARFYDAYEEAWPLPAGHRSRMHLYNLYHLLNHLNLFGGGYLDQCISTIRELTSLRRL